MAFDIKGEPGKKYGKKNKRNLIFCVIIIDKEVSGRGQRLWALGRTGLILLLDLALSTVF